MHLCFDFYSRNQGSKVYKAGNFPLDYALESPPQKNKFNYSPIYRASQKTPLVPLLVVNLETPCTFVRFDFYWLKGDTLRATLSEGLDPSPTLDIKNLKKKKGFKSTS